MFNIQYSSGLSPRTLTGARKTRARCQVLECGCSFVIRHSVFNIRYSTGLPPDAYRSPISAGTLSGPGVWMFIRDSSFTVQYSLFNGLAPGRLQEPDKRGHAVRSLGVDVHSSFCVQYAIFFRACLQTLTGAR